MSELVVHAPEGLLNITTGELLEPSIPNAAQVLEAARDVERQIREVKCQATAWLAEEAERRGTKTLRDEHVTITLTGGISEEYDATDLAQLLREAGCPEDRIEEAITTVITFKVDRSVLRQLAGANKNYRAAIESSRREVEKPYYASVKTGRTP